MSQQSICRLEKAHKNDVAGLEAEHKRTAKEYKNFVDPEKSHLNYSLYGDDTKKWSQTIKDRIKKVTEKSKTRKNQVVMCELMISASPAFFKDNTPQRTREYFEGAVEYAKEKYGADNMISAIVHLDESTPHMHLTFVPFQLEGKQENKLRAGEIINKPYLASVSRDFHSQYAYKYGLEKPQSGKEYLDLTTFKLNHALEELAKAEQKIKELNQQIAELQNSTLIGVERQIDQRKKELDDLKESIKNYTELKDVAEKEFKAADRMKYNAMEEIENLFNTELIDKLQEKLAYLQKVQEENEAYEDPGMNM